MERAEAMGWRGAIVGGQGRGKTTLLEDLAERISAGRWGGWEVRWVRLSAEKRGLSWGEWCGLAVGVDRRTIVFVDGAEQLWPACWLLVKWLSRRAGGLVITSHGEGLLPTIVRCETSADALAGVVGELGIDLAGPEVQTVFSRHEGNVREALRELYDRWAGADGVR
jgi:hypothetical protein